MLSQKWIDDLIELEGCVIGGILTYNEYFDLLDLTHDDFFNPLHREIYREFEIAVENGSAISVLSIRSKLPYKEWEGQDVGKYLISLMTSTTVFRFNIEAYQRNLKDSATKWRLHELAESVLDHEGDTAEIISDLEVGLSNIHKGISGKTKEMPEMIEESLVELENIQRGVLKGLPTRLSYLDHLIGGLHGGRLYIIAGRPAMGKSTLASQIAMNIVRQGKAVLFFNLEMGYKEQLKRVYSEMIYNHNPDLAVHYKDMDNKLEPIDFEKVCRVANKLKLEPLRVDDTCNLSLMRLKTKIRAYMRQFERANIEMGVIFVDYLQLMAAGSSYRGNRVQEISELTRGLKLLANELELPIVVLAQLSRAVEQRENKRPMLSDLRESGSIEQDADAVLFTYRPEYYLEKEQPKEGTDKFIQWQVEMQEVSNMMEIIVAKQRNGPTGIAYQSCDLANAAVFDKLKGEYDE